VRAVYAVRAVRSFVTPYRRSTVSVLFSSNIGLSLLKTGLINNGITIISDINRRLNSGPAAVVKNFSVNLSL